MKRRSRVLLGVLALALPAPALAQRPAPGPRLAQAAQAQAAQTAEPQTAEQARAQQRFQKAKELYAAGSYREAVTELESARALDPKAKDLVFNLGIVHEKLARYDEAITDFRQYMEMDGVTSAEKQKAESIIKRIEGAKREVPTTPTAAGSSTTQPPNGDGRPADGDTRPPPAHGRVDAATITAASIAVLGLGAGAGFGIAALSTRPNDFVTGRDGTYAELQKKTDDAHTLAVVSDIGFGVGVVSAVVAAYLYFGRTKEPQTTVATPALLPGGGALLVGGTFR
jgi:hypothetical protein